MDIETGKKIQNIVYWVRLGLFLTIVVLIISWVGIEYCRERAEKKALQSEIEVPSVSPQGVFHIQ
ncbi:MAG: hypothetical protein K6A41_06815 [Bacteroidales bacterium]|nr:hypothetical protein [Bacteroidales bacterium]